MTVRMHVRLFHLGFEVLELHREHYGKQQEAPDHAGTAGVCFVNDVRLTPVRKPGAVQYSVLEGGHESKVPEVCRGRKQQAQTGTLKRRRIEYYQRVHSHRRCCLRS